MIRLSRLMTVGLGMAIAVGAWIGDGARAHADLPGASFFDTFFVEDFMNDELPGGGFSEELARAYQERTIHEASVDGNWIHATAFYNKSRAAQAGEPVAPWDPAQLGVDSPVAAAAYQATLRRAQSNAESAPAQCAQMVAYYDHWVEQLREGAASVSEPGAMFDKWSSFFKSCSAGGGAVYGFPSGSCSATNRDGRIADEPEKNRRERAQAAAFAKELGELESAGVLDLIGASIQVDGHASRRGGAAGNQRISVCRANWMRGLLVANGVRPERITVQGFGETALEVATRDGVENYFNRRVVTTLR